MKYKILLLMLCVVLILPVVTAEPTCDFYWNMSQETGYNDGDTVYTGNFSFVKLPTTASVVVRSGYTALRINSTNSFRVNKTPRTTGFYTYIFIFNQSDTGGESPRIKMYDGGGLDGFLSDIHTDNAYRYYVSSWLTLDTPTSYAEGTIAKHGQEADIINDVRDIYIDDVLKSTDEPPRSAHAVDDYGYFNLRGGKTYDLLVVVGYNGTYGNGTCITPSVTEVVPSPKWLNQSLNGTLQSVTELNLYINITDSDTGIVNFTIEDNGTNILNVTSYNISVDYIYNITTEKHYILKINVTDGTNTNISQVLDIKIDRTDGIVTTTTNISVSPFGWVGLNFWINTTCTDANLFGCSRNITYPDGTIAVYDEYLNLVGTSFSFGNLTNFTTSGNYTVFSMVSDDHTLKMIKDYDIALKNRKVIFNNIVTIEFISVGMDSIPIIEKEIDRYTINFKQDIGKKQYKIVSKMPIYHRSKSSYKGHLVTGDYWIDFENKKDYPVKIINKGYDKGLYWVVIETEASDFNSIGGVNKANETTYFFINNITTPYINISYPINNSNVTTLYLSGICSDNGGAGISSVSINDTYFNDNTGTITAWTFMRNETPIQNITFNHQLTCTNQYGNTNSSNVTWNYEYIPPPTGVTGTFTFSLANLSQSTVLLLLLFFLVGICIVIYAEFVFSLVMMLVSGMYFLFYGLLIIFVSLPFALLIMLVGICIMIRAVEITLNIGETGKG